MAAIENQAWEHWEHWEYWGQCGGISGKNHSFLRQLPSLVFLSEIRGDLPDHFPVLREAFEEG
jgi:hypothetical protein